MATACFTGCARPELRLALVPAGAAESGSAGTGGAALVDKAFGHLIAQSESKRLFDNTA